MKYIAALALTSVWIVPLVAYAYATYKGFGSHKRLGLVIDAFGVTALIWFIVGLIVLTGVILA